MFLRILALGACALLAGCNTRSGSPSVEQRMAVYEAELSKICGRNDGSQRVLDCRVEYGPKVGEILLAESRANRQADREASGAMRSGVNDALVRSRPDLSSSPPVYCTARTIQGTTYANCL